MDQKICPPVTSLTLLKMMASRRDVPGMPYIIMVSLRYIDVQKRPLTMGDASAILPSMPLRINSHTAGILSLMSVFLIRGILRSEKFGLEFSEIAFTVSNRSIC